MRKIDPFVTEATPDKARHYMGSLMTFLARHEDTDGRTAVILYETSIGREPPPHVHPWEHELYYVLEGEVEFFVEGAPQTLKGTPGGLVFLPAGKAHAFYVRSSGAKLLLMLQASGERAVDGDTYFQLKSAPEATAEVTYSTKEDLQQEIALAAAHGMVALSPEESAERLPHYPGFLANLQNR